MSLKIYQMSDTGFFKMYKHFVKILQRRNVIVQHVYQHDHSMDFENVKIID